MNIQKILKLKDGKYKILLDEITLTTYDDIIIKYNILYKKEIDEKLYKSILDNNKYYDLYNDTLKYCVKKIRCENEVYEYLLKKEVSINTINKIIDKLKNINIINDKNYVIAYINDKIILDNIGINKIKNNLLKNNIDNELIDSELSKIDPSIFNDKLKKIILKLISNNKKYSSFDLKNRIINNLILKGYNKEDIISELENYNIDDACTLEKNYIKLKNKYNDESKIINKLLSKGFKYDKILEIIKKGEE